MNKRKKSYPMNGPTRHTQELMERPRANRVLLKKWLKDNPSMREETREVVIQALKH